MSRESSLRRVAGAGWLQRRNRYRQTLRRIQGALKRGKPIPVTCWLDDIAKDPLRIYLNTAEARLAPGVALRSTTMALINVPQPELFWTGQKLAALAWDRHDGVLRQLSLTSYLVPSFCGGCHQAYARSKIQRLQLMSTSTSCRCGFAGYLFHAPIQRRSLAS